LFRTAAASPLVQLQQILLVQVQ